MKILTCFVFKLKKGVIMFFNPAEFKITGTYIWYYCICKREVWLLSRGITADQADENMDYGRFLHENTYLRDKKEIDFYGMKLDIIKKENEQLLIGEIKKSSKYLESAKMQLLFYLYELEKYGIEAEGVLLIPEEKKRHAIILNEDGRKKLKKALYDIRQIVTCEVPPKPEKINFCKNCAYNELCWS